jgi:hypothetical protein
VVADVVLHELDEQLVRLLGTRKRDALVGALKRVIDL